MKLKKKNRKSQFKKDIGLVHINNGNYYFYRTDTAKHIKRSWPITKKQELGTLINIKYQGCMDAKPDLPAPILKILSIIVQESVKSPS